jgi:predicted CopG family antitoxin
MDNTTASNGSQSKYKRHTIAVNERVFAKLIDNGRFGESYSDVILRLLDDVKKKAEQVDPTEVNIQ